MKGKGAHRKQSAILLSIIVLIPTTSFAVVGSAAIAPPQGKPLACLGHIIYVGGTGPGNFTKIQDAINSANDGDTVFVFSKNTPYVEHLTINKSIDLLGEDRNITKIDGQADIDVVSVTKDDVRISGFTIKNMYAGISFANGLSAGSINNLTVTDCKIYHNKMEGMRLVNDNHVNISHNYIMTNGLYGIELDECSDIDICANDIVDNPSHGLCVYDCSNLRLADNNISNNCEGILFSSSVHTSTITGNLISNNSGNGINLQYYCTHVNISGNTILNNVYKGILIKEDSHNASITKNLVMGNNRDYFHSDNNGGGISVFSSNDLLIQGNEIQHNTHEQLYVSGITRASILHNDIRSDYGYATLSMDNCFYSTIQDNNFRRESRDHVGIYFSAWGDRSTLIHTAALINTDSLSQNYWGRPRLLPKVLRTPFTFKFGYPEWPGISVSLPYVLIDFHPVILPYRIALSNDSPCKTNQTGDFFSP